LTNKTTYYLSGQPKFKKKRIDKRSAAGAVFTKYIMLRYYFIMRSLISIEMLLKEKTIKNWHKDCKLKFIKLSNPELKIYI
jgi:predicted GIY-YIG superfamily endonuclease